MLGKHLLKKVSASIAATAMGLAPMVTTHAAAEDVIDTTKKGSLEIYKYDLTAAKQKGVDVNTFTANGKQDTAAETALANYAIKGVEFSYLRVGDVRQYTKAGDVTLEYEIPQELQTILGLTTSDIKENVDGKKFFTAESINNALAKVLENNTATKDKLEDYMGSANSTKLQETDAAGHTSASNLDLGLYLIVETKVPENVTYTTNPWFVQLPMTDTTGDHWFYDVYCYPKNETGVATLKKKVRNNPDDANVTTSEDDKTNFINDRTEYTYQDTVTASEGETLDYYLESKLPHITSKSTYLTTYTFKDKMSKGITYGKNAVLAIYDSNDVIASTNVNNVDASGAKVVWKTADNMFTQTYDDKENTMTIAFTEAGLKEINTKYSDCYIGIYYTATVNSDASAILGDKGNPNDVTLTWKRSNTNYYDILKDECIVYSFALDLTKKFSDDKGDFSKVQFVVQNMTDKYFLVATGSNGVYHVTGKSATEAGATQFTPSAEGKLVINGVEADKYDITETHSDAGYSLLKEAIHVDIKSTTAVITPTEANITGIQSKSGKDSTNNVEATAAEKLLNADVTVVTTSASATVDDQDVTMKDCVADAESHNAVVPMNVTNQKGFQLPKTGGKGTYLVTIAGILAIGLGYAVFGRKSKKETE